MDFIANGQAFGSVANTMLANGFNISALRPFVGTDGNSYITRNRNGKSEAVLTRNAEATLRRDEWKLIDEAVIRSARTPLRVVADLRAAGLTLTIPNGMGKVVLESAVVGDITGATVSMDPARKSEGDRPEFDINLLPLPIIHKDFYFTARQIEVSRNSQTPLDTTMIEAAGRKVAEEAEKLVLGTSAFNGFSYGGGTLYGLTTFPDRLTKTLTLPTDGGWTPQLFINQVLAMRQLAIDNLIFGPFVLYLSPSWDAYLDADYSTAKGDNTLRQRLAAIEGLQTVRTSFYLTGYQILLVQMTSDKIREVIGMDITTLQWPSNGGLTLNYKVMAMMVPQIRSDMNGQSGIVHGVAA